VQALARMNAQLGVTIVFVSHDPDHRKYAKHLIVPHAATSITRMMGRFHRVDLTDSILRM
jgi:ABC-type lipoprotein export system ATPase subunit